MKHTAKTGKSALRLIEPVGLLDHVDINSLPWLANQSLELLEIEFPLICAANLNFLYTKQT
jgi:hypothetical protein